MYLRRTPFIAAGLITICRTPVHSVFFSLLIGMSPCWAQERPNVVVIICDDLNTHVSPSGYAHTETPAMASLAANGLTVRRAYCQYPVCGPSRASFLSGLYPESTGVLDNKTDIRVSRPGTIPLPQVFKQAGYWTAGVGKVFHNARTNPGDGAWHRFEVFQNDELPVERKVRAAFESEHGPIGKPGNERAWRRFQRANRGLLAGQTPPGYGPTPLRDEQHKDGKNARRVTRWLDEKSHGDRPFFIMCGIQKPHVPFLAPQAYFDRYPLDGIRYRATPRDDWKDRPARAMNKRFRGFGFELGKENDPLRRKYMQAYHACVTFIDAQIRLVLDALKRNGHWEDTIVILTSDHGYHLGEHSMWGKVTLFEECARVPMIVRVPGRTKGGTSTQGLVELVDLFPTLVDLCGMKAREGLQGRSFAGLIDDPRSSAREVAYTVVRRGKLLGRSIRTSRWRYAEWGGADHAELYDLAADPHEDHNLIRDERHRDMREELQQRLADARERARAAAH